MFGSYPELLLDPGCNDAMWRFWAEKQGARIKDPRKRAIICPLEPLYPFGAKRVPLEQTYFEVYTQDNVDVIDVSASPIVEFAETGIRTEKEGFSEFDVVLAMGFDAVTGGLTDININGTDWLMLGERWKHDGIFTNFGMACNKYPNMFFFYGP